VRIFLVAATLLACAVPARAQMPPIGAIDFYGARTVPVARLREALRIHEGDSVTPALMDGIPRLEAVPGVARAAIDLVCCEEGRTTIYVGIEETGSPALTFDPAPAGQVRLPEEVLQGHRAFQAAFEEAIAAGDFAEDDSAGHALMHFPAARRVQERFVVLAAMYFLQLRTVLHESADQEQRAIAAQVLAYLPGKKGIVSDLVKATRDPFPAVRNNAVRALALIARYARRHPDRGILVPYEPLVELLNSLVWTDRNKSSLALMQISESRDPALLALLKARALHSLMEMARWHSTGHALPALFILGRIGGMEDGEIFSSVQGNRRDVILEAAQR
jgi:hypothetical protein